MEKIDVVIPTFNRLWALKTVIPVYIQNQDIENVIVIDDGSNDGTSEWLNQLKIQESKLIVIRHPSQRGAGSARNSGAQQSKSSLVLFSDDDMVLYPENSICILRKEMNEVNADIIGPLLVYDENNVQTAFECDRRSNKKNNSNVFWYSQLTLERIPQSDFILSNPAAVFRSHLLIGVMLMKKSVVETIAYDEYLGKTSYRDETDFCLKSVCKGYKVYGSLSVALINLDRAQDKSGCHSYNHVAYEISCCINNWHILKRHKETLKKIGVFWPILIMQLAFVAEHMLNRLLRKLTFPLRKKLSLTRKLR